MAKLRTIEDIQNDLAQHTFGLGELEYNYSQYDTNRARVLDLIKAFSTELQNAQKKAQAEAVEKHEKALKEAGQNGATPIAAVPQPNTPAPELQQ